MLCRSTNTSPGAGATGHTMARSASMALAAQAAAAAALKHQTALLTPNGISLASPSHSTHDYTPGSFAGSASLSRELPTPETLTSRRAELDGSCYVDAGDSAAIIEATLRLESFMWVMLISSCQSLHAINIDLMMTFWTHKTYI